MKFFKDVTTRLEDYIDFEFSKEDMSLNDIKGLKEGYAQIVWVENVFKKMLNKTDAIKKKYEVQVEKVTESVTFDILPDVKIAQESWIHNRSFCTPAVKTFIDPLYPAPPEIDDDWGLIMNYYDDLKDLKALKDIGYPGGVNNVDPIHKLLSNPLRWCVGAPSPHEETDDEPEPEKKPKEKPKSYDFREFIDGEYKYKYGGATINIPIIKNLDDIPPSLYYYRGKTEKTKPKTIMEMFNTANKKTDDKGIYMRLTNGVVMKIPKAKVIPENAMNARQHSIKCNKENCTYSKCTFAHRGTTYVKVGYNSRCPTNPSFSNSDSLGRDLSTLDIENIRLTLFYSSTDLFSCVAWCQDQIKREKYDTTKNIILQNLDLCDNYKSPFKTVKKSNWGFD